MLENVKKSYNELWQGTGANPPDLLYGSYITKDAHIIHINALQPDRYRAKLCHVLALENLMDGPRFNSDEAREMFHQDFYQIIKNAFSGFLFADIYSHLASWGIPFAEQQMN